MRKTLTWLALAAAVAYLTYLALREEQTLIASATAHPRDLQQTYSEEGRTRLKNRYHIHAPVSGTLRRITLQAGDSVRAGQTLAEIEPAARQSPSRKPRTTRPGTRPTRQQQRQPRRRPGRRKNRRRPRPIRARPAGEP